MFSSEERVIYKNNQIIETICQLRFPTILSISAKEPADFQDQIRHSYPQYSKLNEKAAPRLVGQPGNVQVQQQEPTVNHQFISQDNLWKINMTNQFLSLSTQGYQNWEEFAAKLDEILVKFISVYQPAYFERIGLRYINTISRKKLQLEGIAFADLIQPGYLGILSDSDVQESSILRVLQEAEINLQGGCRLKLHCGPGIVKRKNTDDNEIKFILDNDLYMTGRVELQYVAGALNTLHTHADRVFRGQITTELHNAMEPLDR